MKLHHYLRPELVLTDLRTDGVSDTLRRMVDRLAEEGLISDAGTVLDALLEREASQSTGLGGGIAIPHAVCSDLEETLIELALAPDGVEFGALDEEPVHLFFLLLSPPEHSGTHIKLLARIARLMRQPGFLDELLDARTPEGVIQRVRSTDEEHP